MSGSVTVGRVIASATVYVALVAPCGIIVSGCRRGPTYETAALAGRVLIDGKPVAKGGVQFMPIHRGQPAFSELRDGGYSARVPIGRLRVIFSSVKETGRTVESYGAQVPEILDVLPQPLRDGIEITVEGDDPSRDFLLSSRGSQQR